MMLVSDDQLIAVFDVETTGLSAAYGDRICEVGIVRARGDEILDTYQSLVNPQRPISPGAAAVNGLSDALVGRAPAFADIAADVLAHIDGAALICHNAPFDLSFLDTELARLGLARPSSSVVDTLALARRYFRFRSNSLSAVAANLGVKNVQAHRALGDALTTYHVFRIFCRQLSERGLQPQPGAASYAPRLAGSLPPAIQAAIEENRTIEITYLDAQGNRTCRRITPRQALAQPGGIQLLAFCHLRQAERSFRLDRIIAVNSDSDSSLEDL